MNRRYRSHWERPRREICELVGRRMSKMIHWAAANAWYDLGKYLEENLSETDVPKFAHLIVKMRRLTVEFQGIIGVLKQKGYDMEDAEGMAEVNALLKKLTESA